MDLEFTAEQHAFRGEVRSWLAANVPDQPLQTFDTAEGFKQHREWEATLNKGRWGMVTWPESLGGRACDLCERRSCFRAVHAAVLACGRRRRWIHCLRLRHEVAL